MFADDEEVEQVQEIAERRKLRQEIKSTVESIHENRQLMANINSNKFQTYAEELRKSTEKASHTRELSLDAVGMRDLSVVVKAQAASLQQFSSKLDFSFLKDALRARFSQRTLHGADGVGVFDWAALGGVLSPLCLSAPPSVCLLGALQQEIKTRKVAVRRRRGGEEEQPEVRPESLAAQESELDEATNERVATLMRVTAELSESSAGQPSHFDALALLVDPTSSLQTVENFFDFAFLLKEKRVFVEQGDGAAGRDSGIRGVAVEPSQLEGRGKQQRVLTLPMKDLRLLAKLLHGQKQEEQQVNDHPLHRTDALYEETDALRQSRLLGSKRKHMGDAADDEGTTQKAIAKEATAKAPTERVSAASPKRVKASKRKRGADDSEDEEFYGRDV